MWQCNHCGAVTRDEISDCLGCGKPMGYAMPNCERNDCQECKDDMMAEKMFNALAKKLVSRILAADAICDPHDVEARLISIIAERDTLKARHS